MKKLIIILFVLISALSFGQPDKQSITWLRVEDITNTRYFIWHGDTIDFSFLGDSLVVLKSDSVTLYTSHKHLKDSIDAAKAYADQVAGAGVDSLTVINNIIRLYFNEEVIASDTIFYVNDSTWQTLTINDTLFLAGDTIMKIQKYDEGGGDNHILVSKKYVDNASSGALSQKIYEITLPIAGTLSGSVSLMVEGTDYPTGWVISTSGGDLIINHGKGAYTANVSVKYNASGDAYRQMRNFDNAYSGILDTDNNNFTIESISQFYTEYKLRISILFE